MKKLNIKKSLLLSLAFILSPLTMAQSQPFNSYFPEVDLDKLSNLDQVISQKVAKENCSVSCAYFNNVSIDYDNTEKKIILNFDFLSSATSILSLPVNFKPNIEVEQILINNEKAYALKEGEKIYAFAKEKQIKENENNKLKVVFKLTEEKSQNIVFSQSIAKINIDSPKIKIIQNQPLVIEFIQDKQTQEIKKIENKNEFVSEENKNSVALENNLMLTKNIYLGDEAFSSNEISYILQTKSQEKTSLQDTIDEKEVLWTNTNQNIVKNNNTLDIQMVPGEQITFKTKLPASGVKVSNTSSFIKQVNVHSDNLWTYQVVGGKHFKQFSQNSWFLFPGQSLSITYHKLNAVDGKTAAVQSVVIQKIKNANKDKVIFKYNVKSSLGQEVSIEDNKKYNIEQILVNGNSLPVYEKNNKIFLNNGLNDITIEASENNYGKFFYSLEPLKFINSDKQYISLNNIETSVSNFEDRFLVFAWGSDIYPSMLLLGIVLLVGIISYVLSKQLQIIGFKSLFVLLLGMSQVGLFAIVLTAVIIFVIDYKSKKQLTTEDLSSRWAVYNLGQILFIIGSIIVSSMFFSAVYFGLLQNGNSYIDGYMSTQHNLYFYSYADKSVNILWLPSIVYNTAMFFWSLFVANALLNLAKFWWTAVSNPVIFAKKPSILSIKDKEKTKENFEVKQD